MARCLRMAAGLQAGCPDGRRSVLPHPRVPLRSGNLSDSVHELHGLEELRLTGCAQVGRAAVLLVPASSVAGQTARRAASHRA